MDGLNTSGLISLGAMWQVSGMTSIKFSYFIPYNAINVMLTPTQPKK